MMGRRDIERVKDFKSHGRVSANYFENMNQPMNTFHIFKSINKKKTFIDLEITRQSVKSANHLKIAHHLILMRSPCIFFVR